MNEIVCVCVCERETCEIHQSESARQSEREKEREREIALPESSSRARVRTLRAAISGEAAPVITSVKCAYHGRKMLGYLEPGAQTSMS